MQWNDLSHGMDLQAKQTNAKSQVRGLARRAPLSHAAPHVAPAHVRGAWQPLWTQSDYGCPAVVFNKTNFLSTNSLQVRVARLPVARAQQFSPSTHRRAMR